MKKILLLFSLAMLYSLHAQESKKTIAVLDFQSSGGLEKSELQALTNRFRGILVQTRAFEVIEREKMGEILKEQNFTMSDQCNSAECAVLIGQLLGVQYMVAGDIGKVGQIYTIDLRMVDVSTGKIVQTKSEDYKGEVEGLLGVMRTIANSLAGKEEKTVSVTDVGDIYIVSNPAKALIFIDGKQTEWVTPKLLEGIPVGKHTIEVRSGELLAKKEIDLMKGAIENLDLKLTKLAVAVKTTSEPMEAEIYIDNELSGTTPTVINIPVGTHTVVFKKKGYQDYSESVTLNAGETSKSVKGILKKLYKVSINAEFPKDAKVKTAEIFVDDRSAGTGQQLEILLPEGKHIIRVLTNNAALTEYSQAINLSGDMNITAKIEYTNDYLAKNKELMDQKKKEQEQLALQKEMERKAKEAKEAKEKMDKESAEKGGTVVAKKSMTKWYLIGGAVLVGGGAAAMLGGGKKGGGGPDRIPDPWWP